MANINIDLGKQSYSIKIAANQLFENQLNVSAVSPRIPNATKSIQLLPVSNQYAIITNQKIADLYVYFIEKLIPDNATLCICLIPDSEQSKSSEQYLKLMDRLLAENFNRSSTIIALGGGVVGDLAGFVAATLHRGCNLVQIPTSLLAQVDSSVGGKTAINHSSGKNLIGCFYQPKVVLIDPVTLKTLDKRQFSAGMAEVIKYAFISDDSFLAWLEENAQAIKELEMPVLEKMIKHCCKIKAEIVSLDEKEEGKRVLLNFGHTFGHAIENITGYGKWLHGEAVAVGMLMASKLSVSNNLMINDLLLRLTKLLEYFNLPTKITTEISAKQMLAQMYRDKKNLNGSLQLILPRDAGKSELITWNNEQSILNLMQEFGAGS